MSVQQIYLNSSKIAIASAGNANSAMNNNSMSAYKINRSLEFKKDDVKGLIRYCQKAD